MQQEEDSHGWLWFLVTICYIIPPIILCKLYKHTKSQNLVLCLYGVVVLLTIGLYVWLIIIKHVFEAFFTLFNALTTEIIILVYFSNIKQMDKNTKQEKELEPTVYMATVLPEQEEEDEENFNVSKSVPKEGTNPLIICPKSKKVMTYPIIMPDGRTYDKFSFSKSQLENLIFLSPETGKEYVLDCSGYPVINYSLVDFLLKNNYPVHSEINYKTIDGNVSNNVFNPNPVMAPLLFVSNFHIMYYVHLINLGRFNPYVMTTFIFWSVLFIVFSVAYVLFASCWRNTKISMFFYKFGVYALATWFLYSMFMIQYYSTEEGQDFATVFNAANTLVLIYSYRSYNKKVVENKNT